MHYAASGTLFALSPNRVTRYLTIMQIYEMCTVLWFYYEISFYICTHEWKSNLTLSFYKKQHSTLSWSTRIENIYKKKK